MGIRHAEGVLEVDSVEKVCLTDISESSLDNARSQLEIHQGKRKLEFAKSGENKGQYDIVIVASTASDRLGICEYAMNFNPKYILVEKPLGQSYKEVEKIVHLFRGKNVGVSVNLNTRMFDYINVLKSDLDTYPQFKGTKQVNYNGGTVGIGANGVHYIDLLFYLFGANRAELVAAEIEPDLIPSGRGAEFKDFGGWGCIKFFNEYDNYLGRSIISLSSTSTVFGGWDIIGSNGRIRINELEGQRVDILRDPNSTLPINRYAGDYLPPVYHTIHTPFLGDLTKKWIESLISDNISLLPSIEESLKVHRILFDWLAFSSMYHERFPIT